jgi:hypothetical protein
MGASTARLFSKFVRTWRIDGRDKLSFNKVDPWRLTLFGTRFIPTRTGVFERTGVLDRRGSSPGSSFAIATSSLSVIEEIALVAAQRPFSV